MSSLLRAAALFAVILLSCHDSTLPAVKGPPLSIPQGGAKTQIAGPLEIVYISPKGELKSPHAQITVTFNKPMVSLELVEGRAAKAPLVIEPQVAGKQRWLGSRALTFTPDKELPGSTTYQLKLPAGVEALDGTKLAEDVTWSFTTPRLQVARTYPYNGSRWAKPTQTVKLSFNQPVAIRAVQKQAVFVARDKRSGKTTTIAARARLTIQRKRTKKSVLLEPVSPLPLASQVTLKVNKELVGLEGPLSMKQDFSTTFSTYGPFQIGGLSCDKQCDPGSSVQLTFTNPVARNRARASVRINGRRLKVGRSNYRSTYVYLDKKLGARRRYTVSVVGNLVDKFGQRLVGNRKLSFATGDYSPYASLSIESGVVESGGLKQLPLWFRNAKSATFWSKPLAAGELSKLIKDGVLRSYVSELLLPNAGAKRKKLRVSGRRNRRIEHRVDLKKLVGRSGRGILAVELEAKLDDDERAETTKQRAVVRITDLAMTAKYSPHSSLVWVTSLASGKPVSGAAVSIYKVGEATARWSGTTDAAGLATAPGTLALGLKPTEQELIFFAKHRGDESFVVAGATSGFSAWRFGYDEGWDAGADAVVGMVFSDRGIYRPGESVQLKGIMRRREKDRLTRIGGTVKVTVRDSRGEEISATTVELTSFGSFHLKVPLPANAPLGGFTVSAKSSSGGTIHGRFRVEEFRAAEFAVTAKAERKAYIRGDKMAWQGSGSYLFGAPMRRAKHAWVVRSGNNGYEPAGHAGYVFTDEVSWWGDQTSERQAVTVTAQGRGKLDDKGKVAQVVELKPKRMTGAQRVNVEIIVTDISRQSIAGRTFAVLHPGEFYIGVKPKETFIAAGEAIESEVIVTNPDGKRIDGARVEGTLYRRTWTSVRKKGMGNAHYFVNRPVETKVASACAIVSKKSGKPARCGAKVKKAGYYVLRLRGRDKRGNPLMTSIGIYATGADYVPWRQDATKVELAADRKLYKVGQVARVMIKSPFANAHGLLTVEGNGIHLRRNLKLKQTATWVPIPLTAAMLPNTYVSVVLVRGRVKPYRKKAKATDDDDPGKPAFKVGLLKLNISQQDRRLKVGVRPERDSYRPGEKVKVALQVRDAAGKPVVAELTVIAADEGVLSLIGYKTPDPMKVFYAHRALSVRTADNRNMLISPSVFGQKGGNPGGGGSGHGSRRRPAARSRFLSTPLYSPSVITDASGKAEVSFELPDNLTTFRLMAIATSRAAEFGSKAAKITVNKPLLLLPTLPRLMRVGDTIKAGVAVHNRSGRGGSVQVNASVKGAELVGAATQRLDVDDGGAGEATFTFRAKTPGTATFRFDARLGDHADGLKQTRPVKLPLVIEAVATSGSTDSAVAEGIVPGGGVRGDVGGLQVTMASSALVGLKAGFEYLLDYPYECVEQTTSRLVPLVLLSDLAAAFNLGAGTKGKTAKTKKSYDARARALIDKLVGKLQKLQLWDGGFAYWPAANKAYPWASAYAAWGLLQAQKAGYRVSKNVLQRAGYYLKNMLRRKVTDQDPYQRDIKVYLAYVLGQLGEKVAPTLSELYEKRDKLATFSKALLLDAMAAAGSDKEAIAKLTDEMCNQVHQTGRRAKVEENLGDGFEPLFHSSMRSSAMVLDALLRVQPRHVLVDKIVRHLIDSRKNGRWRNTQETVYALKALHHYYRVREKEPPDFLAKVVLGDRSMIEKRFRGRSLTAKQATVPMRELLGKRGTLGFIKKGSGTLHYTARLQYARAELPKTPWDEGFFVTRTYERIAEATSFNQLRGMPGKQKSASTVNAGDLVRVTLRIVAPQQMHFVAVKDPLPAGLEAVNFQLMTAAQSLRGLVGGSYRSRHGSSRWHLTPFYHREIRDDRVLLFADRMEAGEYTYVYLARATTAGSFVAPPTHVEQMYAPEVFGRTGASTFTVK